MAQRTWTRKRLERRQKREQSRQEERREQLRATTMQRATGLGLDQAEEVADLKVQRTRRVKSGQADRDTEARTEGLVVGYKRNSFVVETARGVIQCRSRSTTVTPHEDSTLVAVGDRVAVIPAGDGDGVIVEVFERQNRLCRAAKLHTDIEQVIVSNIDQLVVVASVRDPYLKPGLIDRYLVTAAKYDILPVVCLNKVDLDPDGDWQQTAVIWQELGVTVLQLSAVSGRGLDQLRDTLHDRTSVLSGQSGVGKSSLLNALDPQLELPVGKIMHQARKGRHTTTSSRLIPLAFGGHVVDTPGIKEFALYGITPEELAWLFPEFVSHAPDCRFSNCRHLAEPGCAVKQAVEDGRIAELRYRNYVQMYDTLSQG